MSRLTCGHIQHLYSWWWVRLSPETCRVKPLRRIKTQLVQLVGLISLLGKLLLVFIAASMQSPLRWYIGKFSNYIWTISWYLLYFFLNVLPKSTTYNILLIRSRVNRFGGRELHYHLYVLLISKTEVTYVWTCRTNIILYSSISYLTRWSCTVKQLWSATQASWW